jgi:hypothetical protein
MGVTIAYRGRLADLTRIEDFEDRLLDFALEFGGQAQIWRSQSEAAPARLVRGVILSLAPGLESTSLLISPEGWLINLTEIEDAELGRLTEPGWCWTKTQFGPLEGHVALVEMFAALQREFLPDLEVRDEGGYWETRDLAELTRRRATVQAAIDGLADGLARHGLSREAAEDPDILARHIERVAKLVHRILKRPPEHAPVTFPDEAGGELTPEADEALWDEMYKHNRRQQERLQRAIEEHQNRGEDDDEAFENAMRDLGLEGPDEEDESWEEDEAWGPAEEALAEIDFTEDEPESAEDSDDGPFRDRHPLLARAMDLLQHLHELFGNTDASFEPSLRTLFQGSGDVMGGLAQALSEREFDEDDYDDYGLRVVQLKRALRGAAHARGALFSLKAAVTTDQFDELTRTLRQMEQDVFAELARVRSQRRTEDS